MSQTGVLPFVRGIDFTKYNLDEENNQIRHLEDMQRLRWLRINSVGISSLPNEISTLKKLVNVLSAVNTEVYINHNAIIKHDLRNKSMPPRTR